MSIIEQMNARKRQIKEERRNRLKKFVGHKTKAQEEKDRANKIRMLKLEQARLKKRGAEKAKIRELQSDIRKRKLGIRPTHELTKKEKKASARRKKRINDFMSGVESFARGINEDYYTPPKKKNKEYDYW